MRPGALLLGVLLAAPIGSARAAVTVTGGPAVAPDLGRVVAGRATTTFSITTGGVVTRTSGDAIRLNSSTVTTPTITVTCSVGVDLCALRKVTVTITPVAGAGPASIVLFRVGSLTTATFRDGAPTAAASMSFVLNAFGYASATFLLGMDAQLAGAAASGQTTLAYTITVAAI